MDLTLHPQNPPDSSAASSRSVSLGLPEMLPRRPNFEKYFIGPCAGYSHPL